MRCLASFFVGLAVLFSGATNCSGQKTAKSDESRIQNKVKERLQKIHDSGDFPGASLAIILPDNSAIAVCVGLANKEDEQPMKSSSRMMSASIGKTYFAAMAVDLIQRGKIKLDDKLSQYLGDEDWFKRIPNADDLTIKYLMRHQSGVPRYILNRQVWDDIMADPDKVWRPGDQLTYVFDATPLHPAGEGWAYSDTNYILLGLVLEKVSGTDVYKYVDEKFLKPHKLKDTIPNDRRELAGLIQGYPKIFQSFGIPDRVIEDGKFVFNPAMEWCGGGFASTSLDLARWTKLLFSGELLDGEYVSMMTRDASAAPMLGKETRYGLGVMIRPTKLGRCSVMMEGFQVTRRQQVIFQNTRSRLLSCSIRKVAALNRPAHAVMVDLVEIAVRELAKNK